MYREENESIPTEVKREFVSIARELTPKALMKHCGTALPSP